MFREKPLAVKEEKLLFWLESEKSLHLSDRYFEDATIFIVALSDVFLSLEVRSNRISTSENRLKCRFDLSMEGIFGTLLQLKGGPKWSSGPAALTTRVEMVDQIPCQRQGGRWDQSWMRKPQYWHRLACRSSWNSLAEYLISCYNKTGDCSIRWNITQSLEA